MMYSAASPLPSFCAVLGSMNLLRDSLSSAITWLSLSRSTICSEPTLPRSVISMSARPLRSGSSSALPVLLSK
jgi:hypothetical protein